MARKHKITTYLPWWVIGYETYHYLQRASLWKLYLVSESGEDYLFMKEQIWAEREGLA